MVCSFDMATGGSLEQKRQRWEPANHIHTQSKEYLFMNKDPELLAFYRSWTWRRCKDSYLTSQNRLCELCRQKGKVQPATQVHHKIHLTPENVHNPQISLNHDNLMALCDKCHLEQHRKKRWRCDPEGHVHI